MTNHLQVHDDDAASFSSNPQDLRGNSYGNITISGHNARLILGNNYASNADLFETGTPEQRRTMLLNFLHYDGLGIKRNQLALINANASSFKWIENTKFPSWLSDPSSALFWILGKPGSGKSTLMKYLADSRLTLQRLNSNSQTNGWIIVHFFFDYRLSHSTANSIVGMLRLFLKQLILDVPAIDVYIQKRYLDLQEATLDHYIDVLARAITEAKVNVCAFIDGLDEYEGNLMDLSAVLENLQLRTGMKMCLASRPEEAFEEALESLGCPTIIVQDYNTEAISACVGHKVARFSAQSVAARDIFTTELKGLVVTRAEGVILWASLVIDEMIKTYNNDNFTTTASLERLIDSLPSGLGPLYERLLGRVAPMHQREVALALELLIDHETSVGVDLTIELLGEACCYLEQNFLQLNGPMIDRSNKATYSARLKALLGNMIELLPTGLSPTKVRIFHKSLSTYLTQARWTRHLLCPVFRQKFPDHLWKRLAVDVIEQAEQDSAVDTSCVWAKLVRIPLMRKQSLDNPRHRIHMMLEQGDILNEFFPTLKIASNVRPEWCNLTHLLEFCVLGFFRIDSGYTYIGGLETAFPRANEMAAIHLSSGIRPIRWTEMTWYRSCKIIRLYETGTLDIGLQLLHGYDSALLLHLRQRLSSLSHKVVLDLFDLVLMVSIQRGRWSINAEFIHGFLEIFAVYGCHISNRLSCHFQLDEGDESKIPILLEAAGNRESQPGSNEHDQDCPYRDTQAPVMIHWIIDGRQPYPSFLRTYIAICSDDSTVAWGSNDVFGWLLDAMNQRYISPLSCWRKLEAACELGVYTKDLSETINSVEASLLKMTKKPLSTTPFKPRKQLQRTKSPRTAQPYEDDNHKIIDPLEQEILAVHQAFLAALQYFQQNEEWFFCDPKGLYPTNRSWKGW